MTVGLSDIGIATRLEISRPFDESLRSMNRTACVRALLILMPPMIASDMDYPYSTAAILAIEAAL